MRFTILRLLSGGVLAVLLCACGGSAADEAASTSSGTRSSLRPAALEASGPGGGGASSADITCGLTGFEADALRLINQRRAAGAICGSSGVFAPAGALVARSQLQQAAYGHSRDMADHEHFGHDSTDGRTMADRVSATGYAWRSLGENIAVGYGSVQQTVDAWMASDSHCANLMNPRSTEFGLACARHDASRYHTYWTLDFGRR